MKLRKEWPTAGTRLTLRCATPAWVFTPLGANIALTVEVMILMVLRAVAVDVTLSRRSASLLRCRKMPRLALAAKLLVADAIAHGLLMCRLWVLQ